MPAHLEAGPGLEAAGDSLKGKELAKKNFWVEELVHIARRAGPAAELPSRLFQQYGDQVGEMLRLVLGRSAPGTLEGHVLRWKNIEEWARENSQCIYPMADETLVRYVKYRNDHNCGPSVPDAIRGTVAWVCKKIGMVRPDTSDELLLALRDQAIEERGSELKEAVPLPMATLAALEGIALNRADTVGALAWWVLCMVYGSLRYDDAVHVRPQELLLDKGVLRGKSWQTKAERKRRGTPFAVPDSALRHPGWLQKGWKNFTEQFPGDRDYWIPNFTARAGKLEFFEGQTPELGPTMKGLRHLLAMAEGRTVEQAHEYTWHSCKVP